MFTGTSELKSSAFGKMLGTRSLEQPSDRIVLDVYAGVNGQSVVFSVGPPGRTDDWNINRLFPSQPELRRGCQCQQGGKVPVLCGARQESGGIYIVELFESKAASVNCRAVDSSARLPDGGRDERSRLLQADDINLWGLIVLMRQLNHREDVRRRSRMPKWLGHRLQKRGGRREERDNMKPINELLQAAEAQKSVDQDTLPYNALAQWS